MKYLLIILITCWAGSLYAQDWPREVLSTEGTITMYQPQIESYSGDSMRARAAVSIIPAGKEESIFGAIWIDCKVLTDRPTRTVKLEEMEVHRTRFPSGTDVDTAKIADDLEQMIPRFDLTFSLDLLLESVETAQKEKDTAHDLDVNPPKIIVMDRPAVLVRIDGDPILQDVAGTSLKRVVNTPYFLVQDVSSNFFYLHGGDIWFIATAIKGPWRRTDSPVNSVVDLFEQTKSDEATVEDSATNDIVARTGQAPEIVVSTESAELIATDGPIQFAPIEGTGLLYATNTPSRVFLEINTQEYFILISGRWYTAKALTGAWTFAASNKLPADFKNIPPGSPCDDVLADVAGTVPAREAVFDAQIPQMAEVDRSGTTTQVEYDGDPQFEPIDNTGMDYAVNTPTAVIRVYGRYYVCDKGVWFESSTPDGPWEVCINVPEIIYTIPPRCPIYGVRYVRVYSYTPDIAYVGYTAGYTGCYVYDRTVVYGTGYHYSPWYRHAYYGRPLTWGFNVHYNPWTGWSLGSGWGRPHGWFARPSKVDHAGWWGPLENHPSYHQPAKPVYRAGYTPVYHQTTGRTPVVRTSDAVRRNPVPQPAPTLYDLRGTTIRRPVTTEPQPARPMTPRPQAPTQTQTTIESRPPIRPTAPAIVQPQPRPIAVPAPRIETRPSTRENNVYAAPDGSIMRSTPQGWQQRTQNTWKPAPEAPAKQATVRDSEVRQRAAVRTSSFSAPAPARPAPAPARNEPNNNAGKNDRKR